MENLTVLLTAWTQEGLSPALITEVASLLSALVMAWVSAWSLGRHSKTESVLFGRQVIDGLLFPLLALLFAYIAQSLLHRQQAVMLF